MINFINHTDIDKVKWNNCVLLSFFPTFFADYDLLTLANPQWCALILNDYEAVMPLPVKSKLFISYIYTPVFISRLGIFSIRPDSNNFQDFISLIPSKFKQIDLVFNTFIENDNQLKYLHSYRLALKDNYATIYASFSENCKRNIKVAEKQILLYTENVETKDIINLFKDNRGRDKNIHLKEQDYQLLYQMSELASSRGMLDKVAVRNHEGQLLAAALFLKDYQRIWFWFSGRSMKNAKTNAMFFLINEYIKKHAETSLILDFNGSMNEQIARFYRGFGGKKYEIPFLQKSNTKWKKLIQWYHYLKTTI
jgi:hypothetical protein